MAKSYIREELTGAAAHQVSALMSREIGRIIVIWACFEHHVQDMIWQVLALSKAQGRIAVREPRVVDRLEILNELTQLRGHWDDELYKSILSRAKLLSSKRDLIAHGMWCYFPQHKEWHVQLARGSWPKTHRDLVAGSRRITPEGIPLSLNDLKSATKQIDALIDDVKRLADTAYAKPEE